MAISLIAKVSNLVGAGKKLLFSNKSKIGDLFIDGTHLETIDYSSEITNHPIETGSSISDHIYKSPLKVIMEGSITDTSVDLVGTAKNVINMFDGNLLNNVINKFNGKGQKQTAAYEFLKDLHDNKTIVTIVNYLDTFENMVIESLNFPRSRDTGERLFFTITLKQVTLASMKNVSISNNPRGVQDMINSKLSLGKQQTTTPNIAETTKASSSLFNAIF